QLAAPQPLTQSLGHRNAASTTPRAVLRHENPYAALHGQSPGLPNGPVEVVSVEGRNDRNARSRNGEPAIAEMHVDDVGCHSSDCLGNAPTCKYVPQRGADS